MTDATAGSVPVQPSLKAGAIGFTDSLSIGLNSTSPAYSLAAVLGPIVVLVGVYAPGALIASFIPMLLIASAFFYLNRVDQDCGTTFSWVTRAIGPWFGWMGGWAIAMTGVLVVGSLAEVGVKFSLVLFHLDSWAQNEAIVLTLTVLLIVAMTWICVTGTESSATLQKVLIAIQMTALLVFAAVMLWLAIAGDGAPNAPTPSWSWLNPFGAGTDALVSGLLLGVFAYWGWESAVNLNEETKDSKDTPGRAAIVSTVLLLVTYVGTAIAVIAYAGPAFLSANAEENEELFAELAKSAMGGWSWIVLLAVATSAIASTQTTIIPASRTALSMARRGAIPAAFGKVSPRYRTPTISTWTVAVIAIVWFVFLNLVSDNALVDSLTALSLLIAFYYALTGLSCAIYYRHHLRTSVKAFLLIGVGPVIGAIMLFWLLVLSVISMSDPNNSVTGQAWFGLGPPLVIGIGLFGLGFILMVASRLGGGKYWQEHAGVVDPAKLASSEKAS